MISEPIIRRLTLARYCYRLAGDNARFAREASVFASINLLQDSVEFFLLGASEFLNAGIKQGATFEQYLDKVDHVLAPRALPFRAKLIQLNKMRVNAKHYGVRPDASELSSQLLVVREFFEEATRIIFDVDFWSASLVDLLFDGEVKTFLKLAQKALEAGDYKTTLIESRKAFYMTFEWRFDLKPFENKDAYGETDTLYAFMNASPFWARNKEFIANRVNEPFDYILLDREVIERELTSNGIDHATFWNVERLTPAVYRPQIGKDWIVKNDLHVYDENGLKDRAGYVLESIIDILVTKRTKTLSVRSLPRDALYYVDLKKEEVSLHKRADRTSGVMVVTPKGLSRLNVTSSSPGLKDDGVYWRVYHLIGEDMLAPETVRLWGYTLRVSCWRVLNAGARGCSRHAMHRAQREPEAMTQIASRSDTRRAADR